MWFWVSAAIAVEVVRRTYQQCNPKKKSNTSDDSLKEPLFRADGSCPYSCCVAEVEGYETETGSETGEFSSDEIVSDEIVSEETVSSEVDDYRDNLVDNRKGVNSVDADWMQVIGRIYPAGPGRSKLVQFKVSETSDTPPFKMEASVKIHPQPNGETSDQVHSSVGTKSSKDRPSEEYRILPPIQEVMSTDHGNIPRGGDEKSSEQILSVKVGIDGDGNLHKTS
ncbi:unnamed protein product [Calypogeia fissa]